MSTKKKDIKRGDIWLVDFHPQRGQEIAKIRPALILNPENIQIYKLCIVVPIREKKPHSYYVAFHRTLFPDEKNGLQKKSVADCLQVKSITTERLIKKIGTVDEGMLKDISQTVGVIIGAL